MSSRLRCLLATLAGCGPLVDGGDDLGPAFRLVGGVDGVEVSGTATRGYVAWAWLVDGEVGGVAADAAFEPRVLMYALDVPAPPDPGPGTPAPQGWDADGVALLVGLPILVEPDPGASPTVDVDAMRLWSWAAGDMPDSGGAVEVTAGRWAAWAPEHLLVLVSLPDEPDVARLAASDGWPERGPLCRLDRGVVGLTTYRERGPGCAGWEPLAAPGTRTEFQGVDLSPPP